MADRKFKIAVLFILVLAIALLYITVIGPSVQGIFVDKQIEAQQAAVGAIIQVIGQQGYVVLGNETNSIVLVDQQSCPAIVQQALEQQQQQPQQ